MKPHEVFVDTSALLALVNRSDALHSGAKAAHDDLLRDGVTFVSSEWVLAEFLNGCARQVLRSAAIRVVNRIRSSNRAVVLSASYSTFDAVLEFHFRHQDKEWSFVDCSSMMACRERGLQSVFGHDRHFAQFGLTLLL
ncbi:MAG: PIN domain-containing protein [Phycisphaerales bacterium]|nr:PIN domain-containing protein [Phycisphaerales bacterium]